MLLTVFQVSDDERPTLCECYAALAHLSVGRKEELLSSETEATRKLVVDGP